MGRAEDLFNRIVKEGEKAIDDFIADRQSEELFLDFKRSADDGKGKKFHDTDRGNLSKAISGFGNSEGGVVVWGVDCRNDAVQGDVAQYKVSIENPQRFVSRLEGAVSGCTIPAHPHIQHHPVEAAIANTGFVVTYIPRSYLSPHQTVRPPQYFMRAGSDFIPVSHGVLSGLFGRHPQPFVFHNWINTLPKIHDDTVHMSIGFAMCNQGPGIARELYVNATVFTPIGRSKFMYKHVDETNWTCHQAVSHMRHFISNDSYRLSPGAIIQPFSLELYFTPPFQTRLFYEITFGHHNWPMRKLTATVEPETIERAHTLFLAGQGEPNEETQKTFMAQVFPFGQAKRGMNPQEYDIWLARES